MKGFFFFLAFTFIFINTEIFSKQARLLVASTLNEFVNIVYRDRIYRNTESVST